MIIETLIVLAGSTAISSSPTIVQFIIAIFAPSGLATLLTALYMRRKINAETSHTDADAVQILTNTSMSLLEPMKQQITFLSAQLKEANEQIAVLNKTVSDLNQKLDRYENDLPSVLE